MDATEVNGTVANGFEVVRDVFRRNLALGADVGAGLAIYQNGEPVVDLWGGYADPDTHRPWERDTIAALASTTKTFAAGAITAADRAWPGGSGRAGGMLLAGVRPERQG